ncbi:MULTISPECIES: hypothetical protein [unclassified Frankia]
MAARDPRAQDGPEASALRRRVLGWGLASEPTQPGLDLGRDLVLRPAPGRGRDLGVVEGLPNLVQALEIALTTGLGDDVFNTGFGFDGLRMLAGDVDPLLVREGVRVAVVDTLRRDPRVRRIIDVTLVDERGEPGQPGDVGSRRTASVRATFEAASGDPLALSVDGVVPGV